MAAIYTKTSFPYTNGTNLPENEVDWSVEYQNGTAGTRIIDSRVRQNLTSDLWLENSATPANADQTIYADIHAKSILNNDAFGLLARLSGDGARTAIYGGIRVVAGVVSVRAFRFVSATATQIGSDVTVSLAAGETKRLQLEVSGVSPNISVVVKFDGTTHISQTIDVATLDATGLTGMRFPASTSPSDTTGFHVAAVAASDSSGGDTAAPVLSSPTGTETGETTATGTVSTDEGNGTLYAVVTTSGTPPSAADIRAGTGAVYDTSQAVSGTGVQNVSATGLTGSTTYYWHYLHDDAASNPSNIETSASFTTDAGAVPSVTVTEPLKNNTGTVLASQSGVKASVLAAATLESVYEASGLTTNGSGVLSAISNAAITTGQSYHVAIKLADGSVGITGPITAS